jgi:hypothetical protein
MICVPGVGDWVVREVEHAIPRSVAYAHATAVAAAAPVIWSAPSPSSSPGSPLPLPVITPSTSTVAASLTGSSTGPRYEFPQPDQMAATDPSIAQLKVTTSGSGDLTSSSSTTTTVTLSGIPAKEQQPLSIEQLFSMRLMDPSLTKDVATHGSGISPPALPPAGLPRTNNFSSQLS